MAEENEGKENKKVISLSDYGHVIYLDEGQGSKFFITYMPPVAGKHLGRFAFISAATIPGEEKKEPIDQKCDAIIHITEAKTVSYIIQVLKNTISVDVALSMDIVEKIMYDITHPKHDATEDVNYQ